MDIRDFVKLVEEEKSNDTSTLQDLIKAGEREQVNNPVVMPIDLGGEEPVTEYEMYEYIYETIKSSFNVDTSSKYNPIELNKIDTPELRTLKESILGKGSNNYRHPLYNKDREDMIKTYAYSQCHFMPTISLEIILYPIRESIEGIEISFEKVINDLDGIIVKESPTEYCKWEAYFTPISCNVYVTVGCLRFSYSAARSEVNSYKNFCNLVQLVLSSALIAVGDFNINVSNLNDKLFNLGKEYESKVPKAKFGELEETLMEFNTSSIMKERQDEIISQMK